MSPSVDIITEATRLLTAGEHYEALRCLNGATPHRFTALYRREGDRAWNVLLFDKQSPYTPQFPEVSASATYCSMAIEGNTVIVVENALTDPRLTNHAARDTVRSYCGAPLADLGGAPIGTLCHFDFAPLATPDGVADMMHRLARLIDGAATVEALQGDLDRRLDQLASTLGGLAPSASSLDLDTAFDAGAAPVQAMLPRLSTTAQVRFNTRLANLRHGARSPVAAHPSA